MCKTGSPQGIPERQSCYRRASRPGWTAGGDASLGSRRGFADAHSRATSNWSEIICGETVWRRADTPCPSVAGAEAGRALVAGETGKAGQCRDSGDRVSRTGNTAPLPRLREGAEIGTGFGGGGLVPAAGTGATEEKAASIASSPLADHIRRAGAGNRIVETVIPDQVRSGSMFRRARSRAGSPRGPGGRSRSGGSGGS